MKVGSASPTNGPGSGFGYDSAGRLSLIAHVDGSGYIASYGYTYDADSRITQINSRADGVINYTYDDAHQLTSASYATPLVNPFGVRTLGATTNSSGAITSESFSFDENGNNELLTIGDDNQMTGDGTYSYTYDAEGRPLTRTSFSGLLTTYSWDMRGRLVEIQEHDSTSTPQAGDFAGRGVKFEYDPLDRRIRKSVIEEKYIACVTCGTGTGDPPLIVVTNYQIDRRYVYDGQHIVLELDGVTNTSDSADDVIRRVMHGQAIDEVLAEETASGMSWALSDHLGTIRDWVDAATAASSTMSTQSKAAS